MTVTKGNNLGNAQFFQESMLHESAGQATTTITSEKKFAGRGCPFKARMMEETMPVKRLANEGDDIDEQPEVPATDKMSLPGDEHGNAPY